ncbi:DNA-binding transcriptional regulator, MarR family [Seinonella peptonophila]|uniref:DNA-binding transcriptional regulator, MarR family n=1 Tax=Seinonella peptonophila TaxID=112248 RepID=A0A1M4X0I0_9BACL|nr:MarR family transcriptional regulator [Seinonella peptonophila]SHE87008.1 DNA-binding transcriptional regulator, MarR family [Seinonella peptonophila]
MSENLNQIDHEIVMLMLRADFKKALDRNKESLERSSYLILKELMESRVRGLSELAEHFQLDLSTISRQIRILEKNNYIRRFVHPQDARIKLIEITKNGIEVLQKTQKKRLKAYHELTHDWTSEEVTMFAQLLTRLNRAMEKRRQIINQSSKEDL